MPTYGYQCKACERRFEVFQKMTDPALTTCEACGGALKKVLYPVGIQFKGSGFYVNDYAKSTTPAGGNGDKEKAAGGDAPAPASGDNGAGANKPAETKTESSPAPAAGAAPAGAAPAGS